MPSLEEILTETHLKINETDVRLSQRFGIPAELSAMLKPEAKERYARGWAYANNKDVWRLAGPGEVSLFGRPEGFQANGSKLLIRFKSGARVVAPRNAAPADPVEAAEKLSNYVFIEGEAIDGKYGLIVKAKTVKYVAARADHDLLDAVIEKLGYDFEQPLLAAAMLAINIDPYRAYEKPEALLHVIVRLAPLAHPKLHVFYLTVPGTGKTHTAMLYRHALGWEYFNKAPSPASLVGDARTGRATAAASEGLWFDEVDKWARGSDRQALAEAIELMLTGMENCVWKRERGGALAIELRKCIPAVFAGNIGGLAPAGDVRQYAVDLFAGAVGEAGARALVDRIALLLVDQRSGAPKELSETWIRGLVPRATFIRAVAERLRRETEARAAGAEGLPRAERHIAIARAYAEVLGVKPELLEQLVRGVDLAE